MSHRLSKVPFLAHRMGMPARFMGMPARFMGMPARFMGMPARLMGMPARFMGMPARFMGMPARFIFFAAALLLGIAVASFTIPTVRAQSTDNFALGVGRPSLCAAGEVPQFRFGFAAYRQRMGTMVGDAVEWPSRFNREAAL